MEIEHIPDEAVRAYLLGQLDDAAASEVERRYFVGRSCLEKMSAIERIMIEDYLDRKLPRPEADLFEKRYMSTPGLRKVVNDVARERRAIRTGGGSRPWVAKVGTVGALAILLAASPWLSRLFRPSPQATIRDIQTAKAPETVSVRLEPGVTKGASATATRMDLPPGDSPVTFTAELPGARNAADAAAVLSAVNAEGATETVWSGQVRTTPGNGGQEFSLKLPPSTLKASDYILRVTTSDGLIDSTFLFSVRRRL